MRMLTTFLLTFLVYPAILMAQWTPTNGPYGGRVWCLASSAVDTSTFHLYAGTASGVMRSTNGGETWSSTGLRGRDIFSVRSSGGVLFAGGDSAFRSSDGGETWENIGLGACGRVNFLAACNEGIDSAVLFAGGSWAGLFSTTDQGGHWTSAGLGSYSLNACALRHEPSGGTTLFVGTGFGLTMSTDKGATWAPLYALGLVNKNVVAVAVLDTFLFAGVKNEGLYRSTDDGGHWSLVGGAADLQAISAFKTEDGTPYVFAGIASVGVLGSTNHGTNWYIPTTKPTNLRISSFAAAPDGETVFAGSFAGGVFRSTNGGVDWAPANAGLSSANICGIAESGGVLVAGTLGDGVFRSSNGGESWSHDGLFNMYVYMLLSDPAAPDGSRLYAATYDGVFASIDDGASWARAGAELEGRRIDALGTARNGSATNLFAGSSDGVFLSSNGGESWSHVGIEGKSITAFAVNRNGEGETTIYAGVYRGGVYRSDSSGMTWTPSNSGLTDTIVTALAVCASGPGHSSIFAGTYTDIFRSTDDGATWVPLQTGLTHISSLIAIGGSLFAASSDFGVYVSVNEGATWGPASSDQPGMKAACFAVKGEDLFVGTDDDGIWKRPVVEMITGIALSKSELPGRFMLEQNYPNPFNPETNISFELPNASSVRLQVYNILGQLLETLIDQHLAPGRYTARYGAKGPSGIYIFRIEANDGTRVYVERRKSILAR